MRLSGLGLTLAVVASLSSCARPHRSEGIPRLPRTLVLHDETGPHGWLGELYALSAGHLASRFGAWESLPVRRYRAGYLKPFDAVIYVGSTYEEPLPDAFLDDVLSGTKPVLWVQGNLWQIERRQPRFGSIFGFRALVYRLGGVSEVRYKGETLRRMSSDGDGVTSVVDVDPTRAKVLGEALGPDGAGVPWAVRARHLTYVADNPFMFVDENDRYLAFADLLFDLLAPGTPQRHRALVRLEDVSPASLPEEVRASVDVLAAAGVPFSIAVTPTFVDPGGLYRSGGPGTTTLAEVPQLVEVLRHALANGGTLVLHGGTHQYGSSPNPYTGTSVDDFEFWGARMGAGAEVVLTGPVPEDSAAWAADRVRRALREFDRADLPRPRTFEFPHYTASGEAARAIARLVGAAYHRGLYFAGALSGAERDPSRQIGQIFPYEGRDVYGFAMIPENCGPYRPMATARDPARTVDDVLHCARLNLVVRDGWASFYYHPRHGTGPLRRIVEGVRRLGYTFVAPPMNVPSQRGGGLPRVRASAEARPARAGDR